MDPGLTFVLLGNSGVGKSASGNTILGRPAFESRPSFRSVTNRITEVTETVFGRQISVMDTPGVLGNEGKLTEWCQDLLTRPHCLFLVVVSVGRFTDEQEKAVMAVTQMLEPDGLKKSLMLFTNGDALDISLEDFIFEENNNSLPDVIVSFTGKYHLFNNASGGQEQVRELLIKSDRLLQARNQGPAAPERPLLEELRVVLLGLPGRGKSSSGNTILGSDQFNTSCDFNPVSTSTVSKSAEVDGRQVTVVDTPGVTDEVLSPQKLYEEIMRSIVETSPGPHAFIIVVKIGRISKEDRALLQVLQTLFNSDAANYAMVLFTHGDELGGRSIGEMIPSNPDVSKLLSMCGGRYCVFNNKRPRNRRQVHNFIKQIDEMVTANNRSHFTSDMFDMANNFMQEIELEMEHVDIRTRRRKVREATFKRIKRYLQRKWEKISSCFTSCFRKSHTSSDDEEMVPLRPESQHFSQE